MGDLEEVLRRLDEIRSTDKVTAESVVKLTGEVKGLTQQIIGLESWMKSHAEKAEAAERDIWDKIQGSEKELREKLEAAEKELLAKIQDHADKLAEVANVVKLLKLIVGAMVVPVLGVMGLQLFKLMTATGPM
jgi:ElaB/YqjD/DUF883 family membrane-anchored ribosome-binding protein